MITINQVKLATKLAERELENTYGDDDSLWQIDDEYSNEIYTDEAQDKFNYLYDEFYNMIENCEDAEFIKPPQTFECGECGMDLGFENEECYCEE